MGRSRKLSFEGNRSLRPAWSPDGQYVSFIANLGTRSPAVPQARRRQRSPPEPVERLPRPCRSTRHSGAATESGSSSAPSRATSSPGARAVTPRSCPWCRPPSMRSCPRFRPTGAGWRTPRTNPARSRSSCGPSPMPSRPGGRCPPPVASSRDGTPTAANCCTGRSAGQLWSVPVLPGTTFVTGQRHALPIDGARYVGQIGAWDITPDGKRFVMIRRPAGQVRGAGTCRRGEPVHRPHGTAHEMRSH